MAEQQITDFDRWFDSELDPELNLTPGDKELCRHAWQAALSHAEGEPPTAPAGGPAEIPEIGSQWRHRNGNVYTVESITNESTERTGQYPVTVVYRGENEKLWSRPAHDWHRSMTLESAPDERKNPAPPAMIADCLYQAGYEDAKKERDYNPRACVEWQVAVDAMSGADEREIAALREDACFLIERLEEFAADNLTEEGARDWIGHVEPAIARLRAAAAMAEGGGQ